LGTRVEIKNLNSFRALERSVEYEIQRQSALLKQGKSVVQETVGWDEDLGVTYTQRVKEQEQDYRYFPEPDLPPLVISTKWIEQIRTTLPELPIEKLHRFQRQYDLNQSTAGILVVEQSVADYFEETVTASQDLLKERIRSAESMVGEETTISLEAITPKTIANWITGELFALLKQSNTSIETSILTPQALASLIHMVARGRLNKNTAREVLAEMFTSGRTAAEIVAEQDLGQVSDVATISDLVEQILNRNPDQVAEYLQGKESIFVWLTGEVMRAAKGQANPQVLQSELRRQLSALRDASR
jgi:aspartyl-tRNA(Asn)/glutamyl-tRNA(Gln) amidotransferase subunit B